MFLSRLVTLAPLLACLATGLRLRRQDSQPCVCVPYYQCINGFVDVYGTDFLDTRIDGANPECKGVEVCCKLPPEYTNNQKPPVTPSDTSDDVTPAEPRPGPLPPPVVGIPKPIPGLSGCGLKRLPPDNYTATRITGVSGPEPTFFGEFPWMVALFKDNAGMQQFTCGGSLISPSVVMTSAHCVADSDKSEVKVVAGDWDSRVETEPIPPQKRNVVRISVHEKFNKGNLHYDIALLFVDTPFELNPSVDIVCIPTEMPPPGTRCQASGWGKNSFREQGLFQPVLRKVSVPLVEKKECQERLRTTRLGKYFILHESFVCAGGEKDADTCTGDGGGPLVCGGMDGESRRYGQVGIVAWGIECGNEIPGVYTSVQQLYEWVKQQVEI